jgi:XRE family transcriptional regulator, fatty acid utilization regulator
MGSKMYNIKRLGELLKKERETLGYKKGEVARKIGFQNYQTLSSIEAGEREIKAWELFKLAEIYGRKVNYFIPETDRPFDPRILWRNPARTSGTLKAERKFIEFCQNHKKLLELTEDDSIRTPICRLPSFDKATFRRKGYAYVIELAKEYSKLLNFGSRPAYCLSDILEQTMGILVLYMDLGPGGSGASTSSGSGDAILINSSDAPWRRNYDLAHEFFHILTWNTFTDEEIYSTRRGAKSEIEQWADIFASETLLPEDEVRKEFIRRVSDSIISYIDLVQIARDFRVSIEALLWRLVNLKLLSKAAVSKCLEEDKVKKVYRLLRSDDQEGEKPYLSARYVALAIKALELGRISKLKFAEYVGIPFSGVSSFLAKYGYNENEDYSLDFAAT